ncbi:putative nicotinate-nucleotide adenylyltransferase [Desulfosporosinus acididurans]|uniref:bis(5'-nucleosyl)-tetraphosphatase (symmetrical) n=1 Tax=Desulfosporosinus acididurans TaxID=476652 RepID=A0A0J1FSV4_9FIRM|nr:bis(5'-nucleosyl)-tetraphosphatase (symmetrical) YqeK [Desulfosporosinus acididurans]KLU66043.1 putative nicotinate-nucleotide adenylyltransferase [Desulfosporosinus acididurans]
MELRVEEVMSLAKHILSESRFKHTLGVADQAEMLAKRHGVDPVKARCAGLAHDLAKELPAKVQVGLARYWNLLEYPEDEQYPYVLHGRLSAYWLEHYFKVEDKDLLAAIASHTLGRPGMSPLEMLIYSADLTESGRTFPEVDKLRQSLYDDLEKGTFDCVEGTLLYLKESNHPIHPLTQLTYDDLKRRISIGT